ncbi:MAG: hypothetical protein EU981_04580 [Candidatus Liberibacter ctenarytainae]|uniref:Lipoprotein n=1 Tax=Candidatus Liberibacter ctenarytainae TaxID=2020335 RepID=A0A937DM78_9HYPH|nr:hypothetical protein [Candidatus Liberibacter ctenarytainae]
MKYRFMSIVLVTFLLSNCSIYKNATSQEKTSYKGKVFLFSEKSIWKSDDIILEKCRKYESVDHCILKSIKKTGGTIEALQAAQYLEKHWEPGYVYSYQKAYSIGIVGVEYPLRANTNTGYLLIPTTGKPVDVDNISLDIYGSVLWKDFAKKHRGIFLVNSDKMVRKEKTDMAITLTFSYPVRECRGCDNLGVVDIDYKFNIGGTFIGRDISRIQYNKR